MIKWLAMNVAFRAVCFLVLTLFIAGCKLRIIVPEGGRVVWEAGAERCEAGQTCDMDVVDFNFAETFLAEPMEGYFLRYWEWGDRRFCGRSPTRTCYLDITGLGGYGVLEPFLASDEVYYLQPRFEQGNCQKIGYQGNLLWWVQDLGLIHEYLECTIPDVAEPVKHGQYLSYSTGDDNTGYDHQSVCVSTYDLGRLMEQAEYAHGPYGIYLIRHLVVRRNGSSELTHYDENRGQTGYESFPTPIVAC